VQLAARRDEAVSLDPFGGLASAQIARPGSALFDDPSHVGGNAPERVARLLLPVVTASVASG
jgi:hypothetical protein